MDALAKSLKEDFLTCVICYEIFVEPKILPCLHTFCKGCLEKNILKFPEKNDFLCPICREPFSLPSRSVSSLKNNFIFKDMLAKLSESRKAGSKRVCSFCILHSKEVEATHKCITCLDLLCSFCVRHRHLFTRQNAYHEIVLLEDYLTGKYTVKKNSEVICERHNERLRFFCPSCSVPICGECALNDHRRHEFVPLDEARSIIAKEMENSIENAKAKQEMLKEEHENLTSKTQELSSNEIFLLGEVETKFKDIYLKLTKCRQNVEENIKNKSSVGKEKIKACLKENESLQGDLQESISFCENVVLNRSDLEVVFFLNDMKSILLKYSVQHEKEQFSLPRLEVNIDDEICKMFSVMEAVVDGNNAKKPSLEVGSDSDTAKAEAKCQEKKQEINPIKNSKKKVKPITTVVPKCVKRYDKSELHDDKTPNYTSVTWIDKSCFGLADGQNQCAVICKTVGGITECRTISVDEIVGIIKFGDSLACKTHSGDIFIYSYPELIYERSFQGAYTLSSRSSELIWVTKQKIMIFKGCSITSLNILDEEGKSFTFKRPFQFCCLPNNSFALTDKPEESLYLLDKRGQIMARRDFTGQGQLGALSCDEDNRIYMTRYETNNICIFDASGEFLRTISLSCILKKPKAISVMNEEAVLVASSDQVVLLSLK
uniref:Protein PML-like n=1 Tax=Crassostrea virginica TaxID=6565 RepID=A0A8B8CD13_CRAVI|nr:protein PML-like [Crassostrea virginica]XP_022313659.1 protein PML-like [Crassostrea virginica]